MGYRRLIFIHIVKMLLFCLTEVNFLSELFVRTSAKIAPSGARLFQSKKSRQTRLTMGYSWQFNCYTQGWHPPPRKLPFQSRFIYLSYWTHHARFRLKSIRIKIRVYGRRQYTKLTPRCNGEFSIL